MYLKIKLVVANISFRLSKSRWKIRVRNFDWKFFHLLLYVSLPSIFFLSSYLCSLPANGKTLSPYGLCLCRREGLVSTCECLVWSPSSSFTQQQSKYFSFFDQSSRVCAYKSGVNPRGFNVQHSSVACVCVAVLICSNGELVVSSTKTVNSLNSWIHLHSLDH